MSSRWLVTGAQGFIGRYVCAHILYRYPDASVLGIGRSKELTGFFSHTLSSRYGSVRAPLPKELRLSLTSPRYRYQSADITDSHSVSTLMESFRPHIIIHLASALRGDHRECLLRTNIQGTRVLVDSLLRSKDCYCLPVAVLGSSGSVYGPVSAAQLPITEYNHCAPVEGYGKSKLAAEQLAQLLVTEREIRLPIARIFNVVGPGQDSRHVAGRMAAQFTSLRAGRQQSIQLGNLDATRDFIDVSDVARALVLLALDQSASGPFNVASGTELSVLDLLNHFRSLTLSSPQIEPAEEIRNDVRRHYADISRLKAIGFECRRSIEQSVESLLSYYQEIRAGDPASETAMSSPLSPGP